MQLYQEALEVYGMGGYVWGPIDAQAGMATVSFCTGDLAQATSANALGSRRMSRVRRDGTIGRSAHYAGNAPSSCARTAARRATRRPIVKPTSLASG
jgi:hypothetical protein